MTMHAPQPARLILSAPVTPRFTLSKGTGPSPGSRRCRPVCVERPASQCGTGTRSEEHTSELQSQSNLVCRLLLEKKKKYMYSLPPSIITTLLPSHTRLHQLYLRLPFLPPQQEQPQPSSYHITPRV